MLALLNLNSRIASEIESIGSAGNIDIRADRIALRAGGQILSLVGLNSSGNGGDISIDAQEALRIIGENPASSLLSSSIGSYSFGIGNTGRIAVFAPLLTIQDGGNIWNINVSEGSGRDIHIDVPNQIMLRGRTQNRARPSSIATSTAGGNPGGDLWINTGILNIEDGANLGTTTTFDFTGAVFLPIDQRDARVGTVNVNATEYIKVSGVNESRPDAVSIIGSYTILPADSGALNISTPKLFILDGGHVGTAVTLPLFATLTDAEREIVGWGNGGDVHVIADYVEVSGTGDLDNVHVRSSLGNLTGGRGHAGDTRIDVRELVVSDGGAVFSNTIASGNAGKLIINASESITISQSQDDHNGSAGVAANASRLDNPEIEAIFSLPAQPTGDTGVLHITTPRLRLMDEGQISVQHQGTGNAGRLDIQAGQILLTDSGQITAETLVGNGGNIRVRSRSLLVLNEKGLISAESQGEGNGGNIDIEALFTLGFDNSDIVVNAAGGNGGRVNILTQGLLGLNYRDRPTEESSDITASSEFGLSGTVKVTAPTILESAFDIFPLPSMTIDPSQSIATVCGQLGRSRFTLTGRHGLPLGPGGDIAIDRPWFQILPDFGLIPDISAFPPIVPDELHHHVPSEPLDAFSVADVIAARDLASHPKEAMGIAIATNGSLQLVAANSSSTIAPHLGCSSYPNIL